MFSNYHVLYVEDDMLSREIMQISMAAMQVGDFTIFEDSTNFLKRIGALSPVPGIILLDIHMDPHNGFEMLDMLRSHDTYDDTRIIALTASVMNQEVQQLKESGFDGAIAKPLDVETFPELFKKIINGEAVWHIA